MLPRFRSLVKILSLAGFASVSTGGCSGDTGNEVAQVCTGGKPCSVRLTILHTSDIHSRLLPYDLQITQADNDLGLGTIGETVNVGGVGRMAYVLGRERARADRVIHLDSGDCFQGAPIFNFFAGEPEVRALSAMGLEAAVVGNHEYDRGPINVAVQMQRWASFSLLASNYKWEDPNFPNYALLGTVARPFQVFTRAGLKIAVIGMGNLSSLTSIFDQPNKLSMMPLTTTEIAQSYIDLLRPYVDVVAMVTHLGLDVDQRMIQGTTGIDVVMGGHNHVVINPPQQMLDCAADPQNPGYIWQPDPDAHASPEGTPPAGPDRDPVFHPWQKKRFCKSRKVLISHSGAFAKYVGRLDLILSNDPAEVSPTGAAKDYEPINGFEIVSNSYVPFPITANLPDDPVIVEMLQPYKRSLDVFADLDIIAGYSPDGAKRNASNGGDSPLGNLVATAMWLRNGIQTDFSLTNTLGIRADLLPGPITTEQMYNIFPFDNSISKMQLSGLEVRQLFDYVARRSASRGCATQVQIAGARVRVNCSSCNRPDAKGECGSDQDCLYAALGSCVKEPNQARGQCHINACAEEVYIGQTAKACAADQDCADNGAVSPGQCDPTTKHCQSRLFETNRYELATSNYLAGGGSGFRVLQRNTTQFDTKIQQRDALIDYIRQGRPCGYKDPTIKGNTGRGTDGLKICSTDTDCASEGDFVCACAGHVQGKRIGEATTCTTKGACETGAGRCVMRTCRDEVASFHDQRCDKNPEKEACQRGLAACVTGGESCKILSCVDRNIGSFTDGRLEMIGR